MSRNALAKVQQSKEDRNEFWREGDSLKAAAQGAAGDIGAFKKRANQVFGWTKPAMAIRATLLKCSDGEYEATLKQVRLMMEDIERPFQMGLPLEDVGKGAEVEDTAPLFDQGAIAGKVAAEPNLEVKKKLTGAEPPAHVPSPGIPLDEFSARLKQKKEIEEAKALDAKEFEEAEKGPTEKPDETKPTEEPAPTPAPVSTKPAAPKPAKPSAPKLVATDPAETERMTPAQRKANARKIAEEVFTRQPAKAGLGSGGIH